LAKTIYILAIASTLAACSQPTANGAADQAAANSAQPRKKVGHCFFKDAEMKGWSAARGKDGNITVKSDATKQVLDWFKRFMKTMPEETWAWDNAGNNKWLISGKGSLIQNPPSAWAVAKRDAPQVAEKCWSFPPPKGPKGRFTAGNTYFFGAWKFGKNQGAAKELIQYLADRPQAQKLVEASQGFDIPSFCYYADLALQASCRMCLVRIEKMPKLQTSCTIICTDGMVVTTQSEEVEKAQRGMMEFLLANHPLDCPVCDRGGECELQEMAFSWGNLEERFTEQKNYHPEKYLSPMVANDPQRCILCKRCTRVCDEWMGEDAIEAGGRGAHTVIGTYGGWLDCSQCGNCIEVCPTGTLLDATYRHQARPWELTQTISTCSFCSDGCQMSLGTRGDELVRIVARDRYVNGLNGEFLCIKGRFGHPFVNHEERTFSMLIRERGF